MNKKYRFLKETNKLNDSKSFEPSLKNYRCFRPLGFFKQILEKKLN